MVNLNLKSTGQYMDKVIQPYQKGMVDVEIMPANIAVIY